MGAQIATSNPVNPLDHPGKTLYWREEHGNGGGATYAGEILGRSGHGYRINPEGVRARNKHGEWRDIPKGALTFVVDNRRFFLSEQQALQDRREES